MKKKLALLAITAGIFCFQNEIAKAEEIPEDGYYIYSQFEVESGNCWGSYGIDGFKGGDSIDRIILYKNCDMSSTAFIFQVIIPEGEDPNTHPLNEDAPGEIAPRNLVLERTFPLKGFYGHDHEFYVGEDGFYLGAAWGSQGIEHYDWDGTYLGNVINVSAPGWPQSLAFDGVDTWYAGEGDTWWNEGVVYKWKMGESTQWEIAFTYTPEPSSSHHDGMEYVNGNLYLADYMGDYIYQFDISSEIDGTNLSPSKMFYHAPLNHELEGMGFGALNHFWVGSHGNMITELGGGSLQKEIVMEIPIDIKPGSCPNSFSPSNRGVVSVALVGNDSLDVTQINPETIQITIDGQTSVQPLRWDFEDAATPYEGEEGGCHELHGDGILDMTFKFDSRSLVDELGLQDFAGQFVKLKITGNMNEERGKQAIEGADYLRVLKRGNEKQ